MWLWESLQTSFANPTSEWRLQVFRVVLGSAVVWKALASIFYGEWGRLDRGRLDHHLLQRSKGIHAATAFRLCYKPQLVLRALAGTAMACGYVPKAAAGVVILCLMYELAFEYRFNTLYLSMCAAALLVAGDLGEGLRFSDRESAQNTWAQVIIVLVTWHLYWNSAWLKSQSGQFASGLYLAQVIRGAGLVRKQLPLWEYRHPRFLRRMADDFKSHATLWKGLSWGTIAVELCLPPLLIFGATRPYAIGLGVMMHVCFTALLPVRLVPFAATSVGSYILFVP